MRQERSGRPEIISVTDAGLSHSDDIALRQRRYIITQAIRIACVVLATALPVPIAYKSLLLVGAIALPWFGVVMANAGPTMARKRSTALVERQVEPEPERLAIEPSRIIDAS